MIWLMQTQSIQAFTAGRCFVSYTMVRGENAYNCLVEALLSIVFVEMSITLDILVNGDDVYQSKPSLTTLYYGYYCGFALSSSVTMPKVNALYHVLHHVVAQHSSSIMICIFASLSSIALEVIACYGKGRSPFTTPSPTKARWLQHWGFHHVDTCFRRLEIYYQLHCVGT